MLLEVTLDGPAVAHLGAVAVAARTTDGAAPPQEVPAPATVPAEAAGNSGHRSIRPLSLSCKAGVPWVGWSINEVATTSFVPPDVPSAAGLGSDWLCGRNVECSKTVVGLTVHRGSESSPPLKWPQARAWNCGLATGVGVRGVQKAPDALLGAEPVLRFVVPEPSCFATFGDHHAADGVEVARVGAPVVA